MIKRLAIHRFRGIRQGVLEDLGKVNLLIGPNNSGKSAILEMLYLGGTSGREAALIVEGVPDEESVLHATTSVKQDFLGLEPLPRLRQRHGYKETWDDHPAEVTSEGGLAVDLATLIPGSPIPELRLGAPLEAWGAKQSLKFSKEDIDRIAFFSVDRRKKKNSEEEQKSIPNALVPPFFEQNVWVEEARWHFLWDPSWVYSLDQKQKQMIDQFATWAEEGISPHAERVLLFDFHTTDDHFQEKFAQWAKDNIADWYERISDILGRVFPALKDASVEVDNAPVGRKKESGYLRFPGRTRLGVDQFGDGTRHVFKVLASLIALAEVVDEEHPGLFLWEDPELFMHPATLGRIMNEVMKIIAKKPIQCFVTTQSLEIIAWLVKDMENKSIVSPDEVRTFRLDLVEGELQTQKFVGKGLSGWLEFFGDPRLSGEDEMVSPLAHLLGQREEE